MATPGKDEGRQPAPNDNVPIARLISQDAQQGNDDDFTVVVGQRVSAPTTTASAYAVRVPPDAGNNNNNNNNIPVASAQPSSTHPAPLLSHSSGTWTMPGTGTSGGASSGGGFGRSSRSGGGGRPRSGGGGNGGGGRAMTTDSTGAPFPTMTHTGTQNVPGCGTASSTGGRRFGEDAARAAEGGGGVALSRSGSGKGGGGGKAGVSAVHDARYVADGGGGALVACGQGKSLYDVKGCLSSWVLLSGSGGNRSGELKGSVNEKNAAAAAAAGGAGAGGSGIEVPDHDASWALRSEANAAGDGGVTCSSCVPSAASGQGEGSRMLITGGKDSVLREWEVAEGRPRLVAKFSGHTDWISCCALIPSTTVGAPASTAASGGRDGSVRFWSKSASAAAAAAASQEQHCSRSEKMSMLRAAFASGSHSSSGRGSDAFSGEGVSPPLVGDGGWALASCLSSAHGSSEFVTCCASPSGHSGAIGGWVATGGTDWAVRLWDVAKSRELGRLSFMGHSHPVRSLACSSDGNLLVSGGDDQKVIIWSPQSRRPLATLKGHAGAVHGVAVDPGTHSGQPPRWIATGGGEGFLLVWDPRNWGSPVATLRGGEGENDAGGSSTADEEGTLRGGLAGARLRGESGRWEGETTGATMLNGVNCLAAGGAGAGDWLFAAGETVVRSWRRRAGVWRGGAVLPGEGLGGVASLSVV